MPSRTSLSSMPSILVSGNTCLDIVTICEVPYNPSGKRPIALYKQVPGGQAANVADLLANFGNRVSFLGAIGNDAAGKIITDDFHRAGIEVAHSSICNAPHHLAFVRVDHRNGERLVDTYKDRNLSCDDVALNEDWVGQFDCIYVDGQEPALASRLGQIGQKLRIPVIADLEELTPQAKTFLPYTDVLVAPEKIVQELGRSPDSHQAVLNVRSTGFAAVVATRGENGCLGVAQDNRCVAVRGISIRAADTTGAGDTFHAAFVHSMLQGFGFHQSMRAANEIAARKCAFIGARIPPEAARQLKPQRRATPFIRENWLRGDTIISNG